MKPVVALDIDGTLLDYHRHFTAFANQYFGIDVDPGGYDARLPFWRYLGVSRVAYRRCKLAYRRGELKRSLPPLPLPYPQARELTKEIRGWGVDIWLCTTRPYLSHSEVDDATRHNLRRNGVVYQGIIWGEHKYRELVRTVGSSRVVAAVDDLPEMCGQAHSLGVPVLFAMRQHNRGQFIALGGTKGTGWPWADDHGDTVAWLHTQLEKWKAGQE